MLKIRLRRMGAIRQPHYRIVVADARAPRDGAFIETLGYYNPLTDPATVQVDVAKYEEWKKKGAQPTDAVASLVKRFNRAARAAEAKAETSTSTTAPTTDRRTRTASGKRATPAAAPATPTTPEAQATIEPATEPIEPVPVPEIASDGVPEEQAASAIAQPTTEPTAEAAQPTAPEAAPDGIPEEQG